MQTVKGLVKKVALDGVVCRVDERGTIIGSGIAPYAEVRLKLSAESEQEVRSRGIGLLSSSDGDLFPVYFFSQTPFLRRELRESGIQDFVGKRLIFEVDLITLGRMDRFLNAISRFVGIPPTPTTYFVVLGIKNNSPRYQ